MPLVCDQAGKPAAAQCLLRGAQHPIHTTDGGAGEELGPLDLAQHRPLIALLCLGRLGLGRLHSRAMLREPLCLLLRPRFYRLRVVGIDRLGAVTVFRQWWQRWRDKAKVLLHDDVEIRWVEQPAHRRRRLFISPGRVLVVPHDLTQPRRRLFNPQPGRLGPRLIPPDATTPTHHSAPRETESRLLRACHHWGDCHSGRGRHQGGRVRVVVIVGSRG
mmetsp:Transcript_23528/g.72001  ORF Transcript_23528/g.72001 Transcript_23528/m.72001 type:complete len:217 (+) Transcript_23528:2561-3211(+)